jgi:ankyrin repeat protein
MKIGFPQVAEALLDHGAELNARDSTDNTALIMAAKNCSFRISAMLISRGADVTWINLQGRNVLIEAAAAGCAPIVDQLLHVSGIRVDQKDNQGSTALDYAAEEAQVEGGGPYSTIVTALTRAGATHATFVIPLPSPRRLN